ncbi:MAG: DUF4340 domain-containing protein [Rhodospirillales bacterium]|nr:DUF4340 domain-containing protein [Rhodospirillales bacterium]
MRARSFLILSAVTLVVTAAAVAAVVEQDRPHSAIETSGPMLPGLADQLGEVAAIVLRDADRTLTIKRGDSGWGIAELNDYPVPTDKVREIARALVQLEKVEAKTMRADRYARIGVEDVAKGATSKEVDLQNAAGEPLARLIVGTFAAAAGAEGATFVRIPGDERAWLARGTVHVNLDPRDWVDRHLIAVPATDIREVRIVRADRKTLTVVREGGDTGAFHFAEMPAGAKLKRPDAVQSIVETFGDISLEDLKPKAELTLPADKTIHITVTRVDGTHLAFAMADIDGARWIIFEDGKEPATLPAAGHGMAFQIPTWKVTPLERQPQDLYEPASGS